MNYNKILSPKNHVNGHDLVIIPPFFNATAVAEQVKRETSEVIIFDDESYIDFVRNLHDYESFEKRGAGSFLTFICTIDELPWILKVIAPKEFRYLRADFELWDREVEKPIITPTFDDITAIIVANCKSMFVADLVLSDLVGALTNGFIEINDIRLQSEKDHDLALRLLRVVDMRFKKGIISFKWLGDEASPSVLNLRVDDSLEFVDLAKFASIHPVLHKSVATHTHKSGAPIGVYNYKTRMQLKRVILSFISNF